MDTTTTLALYQKERPRQLENVVGQSHVIDILKQASRSHKFVHAYLFSGNHGCGKTSTARILANLMTCEDVTEGKVCGKCRACQTIPRDSSPDVKELDGAKNGGVAEIEILIDAAQWSPQELNRKILIIDEVHQLSKAAISALLKILEEPPSHLTFILCTTEIRKILPTILDRCQRYNFRKISSTDIATRLRDIAGREGILIDNESIEILSKIARGSLRNAIGSLEQIATVAADESVSAEMIQKYFGVTDSHAIVNILQSIIGGKISLLLDQINDLVIASVSAEHILFEISEAFRNIMILKAQNGKSNLVDLPDHEISVLQELGESLTASQLLKLAHLFSDVEKKISYNINERWIMEATLINCIAILRNKSQ